MACSGSIVGLFVGLAGWHEYSLSLASQYNGTQIPGISSFLSGENRDKTGHVYMIGSWLHF